MAFVNPNPSDHHQCRKSPHGFVSFSLNFLAIRTSKRETRPIFTGRDGGPAAGGHLPQLDRRLLEHHPEHGGRRQQVDYHQRGIVQDGHAGRRLPAVRAEHLRRHSIYPAVVGGRHGGSHLRLRNRVHLLLRGKFDGHKFSKRGSGGNLNKTNNVCYSSNFITVKQIKSSSNGGTITFFFFWVG